MAHRYFLTALLVAIIGLCVFNLGTVVYGFAIGDALPTTTIFRLVPQAELLVRMEPSLSSIILAVAAIGAILSWLGWAGILNSDLVGETETSLGRIARRWGLVLTLCVLLVIINSGGWAGHYAAHASGGWGILNLVPWSDSITYFGSSLDRATVDAWGVLPARRPFAQALRDVDVFAAGYSEPMAVLLQTVLISFGLALTAGRIIAWRGLWAGIAFVGFAVCILGGYLATMMTEPLGWILAFFSSAYLCDAIRFRSRRAALIALTGLTMALAVRAGSMLTIPFMVVWVGFGFGSDLRSKIRWTAIGTACVLAVFGVNALLQAMYAPANAAPAASFAQTLCGLSIGGAWGDCYHTLYHIDDDPVLSTDDRALAAFMLRKTIENIEQHPTVLLFSLVRNAGNYLSGLKDIYLAQSNQDWPRLTLGIIFVMALAMTAVLWRRRVAGEAGFWIGFFLSTAVSAAIIYADDGFRALQVTYAILLIPLATAFTTARPTPIGEDTRPLDWRAGVAVLIAVPLLALTVPAMSHAIMRRWLQAHDLLAEKDEPIVLGGRGINGFLVLPDGAQRPTDVPSTYYSDFLKIAQAYAFQRDYKVGMAELPRSGPFAFIIGMRVHANICCYYITVPDVLTNKSVLAWRLEPLAGAEWKAIRQMQAIPVQN